MPIPPKREGWTDQEERVGVETIQEYPPPPPAPRPGAPVDDLAYDHCHDNPHEFIPAIRDQIQQLALVADTKHIRPKLQSQNLHGHDRERSRGRQAHDLRMESAAQPREEGAEQDVGHEGHDGDVHVGGVEVVARGQEGVERVLLVGV